jgi:prephenate dehydrogenase
MVIAGLPRTVTSNASGKTRPLNWILCMAEKSRDSLENTKRLMGALVRMKPKPHDEMKVGKTTKMRVAKKKPGK